MVEQIENKLLDSLPRILPRPEFVDKLKSRLAESPIFQRRRESGARLVVVLIGLLIGFLLYIVGRSLFMKSSRKEQEAEVSKT